MSTLFLHLAPTDLSRHPNPMGLLGDIILGAHYCHNIDRAITQLGYALPDGLLAAIRASLHPFVAEGECRDHTCAAKIEAMASKRRWQEIGEAEDFFCFIGAVFSRGYKCCCSLDVFLALNGGHAPRFSLREVYHHLMSVTHSDGQRLIRFLGSCAQEPACRSNLLASCDRIRAAIRCDAAKRCMPYRRNDRLDIYRDPDLNINREKK